MAEAFALTEVRFVPTGTPPHRAVPRTSVPHRVRMVELALAGNPLFKLDLTECSGEETSYTHDTLALLRAQLGASVPLALIVGSDQLRVLDTWHRWRELFDLAHLVVAHRPGYAPGEDAAMAPALRSLILARTCRERALVRTQPCGKLFTHAMTELAISATEIRTALAAGRSPRYLLPDAVLDYIQSHRLYSAGCNEA